MKQKRLSLETLSVFCFIPQSIMPLHNYVWNQLCTLPRKRSANAASAATAPMLITQSLLLSLFATGRGVFQRIRYNYRFTYVIKNIC